MAQAVIMRRASISAASFGGILDLEPRLAAQVASRRRAHRPVVTFLVVTIGGMT
jgi:hypothetical protein